MRVDSFRDQGITGLLSGFFDVGVSALFNMRVDSFLRRGI